MRRMRSKNPSKSLNTRGHGVSPAPPVTMVIAKASAWRFGTLALCTAHVWGIEASAAGSNLEDMAEMLSELHHPIHGERRCGILR